MLLITLGVLAAGCPFITYHATEQRYPPHAFPTEASPPEAPRARVYEGTLTLPTLKVEALSFTTSPFPMDRVGRGYPYPNLDRRRRRPDKDFEDRTWKTVVLENEYLKVTTLPDLGGRVFEAIFKPTGEQMFHRVNRLAPFDIWECATSWMLSLIHI